MEGKKKRPTCRDGRGRLVGDGRANCDAVRVLERMLADEGGVAEKQG